MKLGEAFDAVREMAARHGMSAEWSCGLEALCQKVETSSDTAAIFEGCGCGHSHSQHVGQIPGRSRTACMSCECHVFRWVGYTPGSASRAYAVAHHQALSSGGSEAAIFERGGYGPVIGRGATCTRCHKAREMEGGVSGLCARCEYAHGEGSMLGELPERGTPTPAAAPGSLDAVDAFNAKWGGVVAAEMPEAPTPTPAAMLGEALTMLRRVGAMVRAAGDLDRHIIATIDELRQYIEDAKMKREAEARSAGAGDRIESRVCNHGGHRWAGNACTFCGADREMEERRGGPAVDKASDDEPQKSQK